MKKSNKIIKMANQYLGLMILLNAGCAVCASASEFGGERLQSTSYPMWVRTQLQKPEMKAFAASIQEQRKLEERENNMAVQGTDGVICRWNEETSSYVRDDTEALRDWRSYSAQVLGDDCVLTYEIIAAPNGKKFYWSSQFLNFIGVSSLPGSKGGTSAISTSSGEKYSWNGFAYY
jgi:hypothetical protein